VDCFRGSKGWNIAANKILKKNTTRSFSQVWRFLFKPVGLDLVAVRFRFSFAELKHHSDSSRTLLWNTQKE